MKKNNDINNRVLNYIMTNLNMDDYIQYLEQMKIISNINEQKLTGF